MGHGEGAWLLLGRMGCVCEFIVLVVGVTTSFLLRQRDRNQAQKCAQSAALSPGSAKALPGNADMVFVPFDKLINVEGALGPPLSVPCHPRAMGGR